MERISLVGEHRHRIVGLREGRAEEPGGGGDGLRAKELPEEETAQA